MSTSLYIYIGALVGLCVVVIGLLVYLDYRKEKKRKDGFSLWL